MIPRTLPRGRRSGSGIEVVGAAATVAERSAPGLRLPRDQGDDEENPSDGLRQAAEPALPTRLFLVDRVRRRPPGKASWAALVPPLPTRLFLVDRVRRRPLAAVCGE